MAHDGFVVFEAEKRPRRLKPDEVSLTKSNIVISEAFYQALGEPKRVHLLFNEQTRMIGIRPTTSEDAGYRVSYRSISARAFYRRFDIHERGRFRGEIWRGVIVVGFMSTV